MLEPAGTFQRDPLLDGIMGGIFLFRYRFLIVLSLTQLALFGLFIRKSRFNLQVGERQIMGSVCTGNEKMHKICDPDSLLNMLVISRSKSFFKISGIQSLMCVIFSSSLNNNMIRIFLIWVSEF